ncbi:MAG: protein-L-isoaspartate O-methyltransferase [Alphaproteobacteria bacterium]|nr:protein-L-isoaspartate O-methyltransferase [Alphaproteobacteria bacterium]
MVDFSQARRAMVDGQLRTADVTRTDILDIFSAIPRELFVDPSEKAVAYADRAVLSAGGAGRKILSAMNLARMIQATEIKPGDRVLDVAGGAGYSTALMTGLGGQVTLLEDHAERCVVASDILKRLNIPEADVQQGELTTGHDQGAPYDIILMNGRCEQIPQSLFQQLKEGGRLVAIVGNAVASEVRVYTLSDRSVGEKRLMSASGSLLSGFIQVSGFVF